jgi:AbiV
MDQNQRKVFVFYNADLKAIEAILENSRRLNADAQLLYDNARYASCVLLEIFCLEELGKILLHLKPEIQKPSGRRFHQFKQEAGLSLALGHKTVSLLEERSTELGIDIDGDEESVMAYWTTSQGKQEMDQATGKASSWLYNTRNGLLEEIRRITTYIDAADTRSENSELRGVDYSKCDRNLANTVFELINAAYECLKYPPAISMAHGILTEEVLAPQPGH